MIAPTDSCATELAVRHTARSSAIWQNYLRTASLISTLDTEPLGAGIGASEPRLGQQLVHFAREWRRDVSGDTIQSKHAWSRHRRAEQFGTVDSDRNTVVIRIGDKEED
jgi:hypothetical protein